MNNAAPVSTDTEVLDRNAGMKRSTVKFIGVLIGLVVALVIIYTNRHAQISGTDPVDPPQPRQQQAEK